MESGRGGQPKISGRLDQAEQAAGQLSPQCPKHARSSSFGESIYPLLTTSSTPHPSGYTIRALGTGGFCCHVLSTMLIPALARATCARPSIQSLRKPHLPVALVARVFVTSPLHRKDVHGQRPTAGPQHAISKPPTTKSTSPPKSTKPDPLLAEQTVSNKEQRKADWAIIKEMSQYLWPKDNLGTRARVGLSVALLVGAKLLNVQIPFYFKSIVDSMNVDFLAVGGTAWTVAGSMIVACKF